MDGTVDKLLNLSGDIIEFFDITDNNQKHELQCPECDYMALGTAQISSVVEHMKTHGYTED